MKWLSVALVTVAAAASAQPTIFFSKSFPGSTTPYLEISVEKSGSAVFNDAPGGPDPILFRLKAEETAAIFGLAQKVGNFSKPLESGLKVANMGKKTFRYDEGGTKNEVHFNYSQNPDAQLLLDWFERISETVQHLINLEKTAKFDRLGVDRAMLLLQVSIERNRLAAAEMLLPILDTIAGNGALINRARERAAAIAEAIRESKPKAE